MHQYCLTKWFYNANTKLTKFNSAFFFSFAIVNSIFLSTFALAFEKEVGTHNHWRDGRVVDYNGLENRRTERYRGFEALSLREKETYN